MTIKRPPAYQPALNVLGDGNCFWRCLQNLSSQQTQSIKKAAFAVKPFWMQQDETCDKTIWADLIRNQEHWYHSASEVTACAASVTLNRAVIIISDGCLTLFSPKRIDVAGIQRALTLSISLHEGHYQYVKENLPMDHANALSLALSGLFRV